MNLQKWLRTAIYGWIHVIQVQWILSLSPLIWLGCQVQNYCPLTGVRGGAGLEVYLFNKYVYITEPSEVLIKYCYGWIHVIQVQQILSLSPVIWLICVSCPKLLFSDWWWVGAGLEVYLFHTYVKITDWPSEVIKYCLICLNTHETSSMSTVDSQGSGCHVQNYCSLTEGRGGDELEVYLVITIMHLWLTFWSD